MSLKTFVKVGCITNLSDARYCAGMGVDMLGFRTIAGQENYIEPAQFQEIRGWISGPLVVAEAYGLSNPEDLTTILENYKPDYIEMGLQELSLFSTLPLPLVLSVHENDILEGLSVQPTYLLSKNPFKSSIPQLIEVQSTEDVKRLLDTEVKGIVLKGGTELKPGLKNFEVMHDVLELLEIEQ
jgi:phosphoribosylanthranilate isomerase